MKLLTRFLKRYLLFPKRHVEFYMSLCLSRDGYRDSSEEIVCTYSVSESWNIEDSADTSLSRKYSISKALGQLHILNLGEAPSTRSRGKVFLCRERESWKLAQATACSPGGHLESQPPRGTCLLQGAVWHAFSSSP